MSVDICFVCSPMNWDANHPPHHYLYLGAYLERQGISYEIIDEKIKFPLVKKSLSKIRSGNDYNPESIVSKKCISRLKELNPKVVGLAVYSSDYNYMMKLAEIIKKEIGCQIVVGNAHASISPQDFIFEGSSIDYAVLGEGEVTLTELLKAIKERNSIERIAGIVYLKDGKLLFTGKRELLADLSIDLTAAYKRIPMNYYTRPTTSFIRFLLLRGAGVYTGRGCPFSCKFCAANVIWSTHKTRGFLRFRPLDDVITEIAFLRDTYQIDGFSINDDTFTLGNERVYNFCEKLKAANLGLIWTSQARVNLISEDMLRAMKDAGCIQIEFGIESASPKCLLEVDKRTKPEDQYKAFEICKTVGLRTFANMLINIPGETEEDIQLSEKFLQKTRPYEVVFAITTPYPGTAIYEKYVNPKPLKEEYDIFLSNRQVGNNRFRLCQHDLNLEILREKLSKRNQYVFKLPYISFSSNKVYLRKLWENKFKYVCVFIELTIKYLLERIWYRFKLFKKIIDSNAAKTKLMS